MAIRLPRIDKLNKLEDLQKIYGYGQRASILARRKFGHLFVGAGDQPFPKPHESYIWDSRVEGSKRILPSPLRTEIDRIIIFDLDVKTSELQDRKYQYLELPYTPNEIEMTPNSTFKAIASPGRNNPHYHFTGSEDTLEFQITWFSSQLDRKDVIQNCRWLEALSKADGYSEDPHLVRIVWGRNSTLFENDKWLLVKAPYVLSQFVNGYQSRTGEFVSTDLLPQMAKQTLTFKRVSRRNRTARDIITNINST